MSKIDFTKPIEYMGEVGTVRQDARIVDVNGRVYVVWGDGSCHKLFSPNEDTGMHLFRNKPERTYRYRNMYEGWMSSLYDSEDEARKAAAAAPGGFPKYTIQETSVNGNLMKAEIVYL